MKIKTVIVDDERLARVELQSLLKKHEQLEIIADFGDVSEAHTFISENQVDLLLLDIQMPEKNGFEFLESLDTTPAVIFITAFDEYALKAFEVNALDYVLKPIDEERLGAAIQKVSDQLSDNLKSESSNDNLLTLDDRVFLKDGEKCWFVKLENVRMFESEGNYIRVWFDKNKPLILKSLNNLEKKLDTKYFFRANRKFIINLAWIENVEPWFNGGLMVTLKDGHKIQISRRQAVRLKDRMSI